MHEKKEILDFIKSRRHMIISTVGKDGNPESAIVGFGQTDDFKIVFGTKASSRKVKNILSNSNVSVVIGTDHEGTVQYEGMARQLVGDEIDYYTEFHFQKHPNSRKYRNDPDEVYFVITPVWLRFTEVDSTPWKITEISLI